MDKLSYVVFGIAVMACSIMGGLVTVEVYAQGEDTSAGDNLIGVVVAVSGLISALSVIIVAAINRSGYKKGDNAMVDKVLNTAEGLKGSDQEILDLREELATVISVVTNISPEAKAELEKRGADIATARKKAEDLRAEIERLYPVVGASPDR